MLYDSDNYEIASATETDELLSDLPLGLIMENIQAQIENPLSTNTNYFNIVVEKYEILRNKFSENPDTLSTINNSMTGFFQFIIHSLNANLDLGIDTNLELDELHKTTDATYNFFILGYKNNIVRYLYQFIKNNKRMISDQYDKMGKKKDVTTMNYKKQLKNRDDVIIMSNLPSIIEFVRGLDTRAEDFISLTTNDNSFEGRYIKYLMDHGLLTGDFVDTYLRIVFDENDYVLDEIQVELRMKLSR